jgi:hypothetical protein
MDVNPATVPKFHPLLALEFSISSTHGVGVHMETSRQFTSTRQAFARSKFSTQNAEDNLGYELFSKGNLAVASKPVAHALIIPSLTLETESI